MLRSTFSGSSTITKNVRLLSLYDERHTTIHQPAASTTIYPGKAHCQHINTFAYPSQSGILMVTHLSGENCKCSGRPPGVGLMQSSSRSAGQGTFALGIRRSEDVCRQVQRSHPSLRSGTPTRLAYRSANWSRPNLPLRKRHPVPLAQHRCRRFAGNARQMPASAARCRLLARSALYPRAAEACRISISPSRSTKILPTIISGVTERIARYKKPSLVHQEHLAAIGEGFNLRAVPLTWRHRPVNGKGFPGWNRNQWSKALEIVSGWPSRGCRRQSRRDSRRSRQRCIRYRQRGRR